MRLLQSWEGVLDNYSRECVGGEIVNEGVVKHESWGWKTFSLF